MTINRKTLLEAMESAAKLQHPDRLIRVTLECSHFKLMPFSVTSIGGIGWSTSCNICSEYKGREVVRQIINQEETGVL